MNVVTYATETMTLAKTNLCSSAAPITAFAKFALSLSERSHTVPFADSSFHSRKSDSTA